MSGERQTSGTGPLTVARVLKISVSPGSCAEFEAIEREIGASTHGETLRHLMRSYRQRPVFGPDAARISRGGVKQNEQERVG